MDQHQIDFWQREAARYETNVHALATRSFALIGVGFTALGAVAVGMGTTGRQELVLLVPLIVVLVAFLALWTLEEVLVKALYQYRAERLLATALKGAGGYLTWEDFGGRLGMKSGTTIVRAIAVATANIALVVGAIVLFSLTVRDTALWTLFTQFPALVVTATVAGVIFFGIVVALVFSGVRMLRMYFEARRQLGYDPAISTRRAIAIAASRATPLEASAPSPARRRRGSPPR
jgi:hypothetical protein